MFVKKITANELFSISNIKDLITEYSKCANVFLNGKLGDFEFYKNFYLSEANQKIEYFVLMENDLIKGIFSFQRVLQGHLGTNLAVMDSEYVTKEYRHNGGSKMLLDAVYKYLKDNNVTGLILSAQSGSRLEKVYDRKYQKTDSLYLKRI